MNESKYIKYADGTKEWYFDGRIHREDGPAVEWANGTKDWCINGMLHREDGPAIERSNGENSWYLNGVYYETPDEMPLSLFLAYCRWERNKNG